VPETQHAGSCHPREKHARRRAPVEWETPSGQVAHVSLELRFSAFHGYGGPGAEAAGYLGLQCHGVLWPSPEAELPHYWPIAPPIVSGKVRAPPSSCSNSEACWSAGVRQHAKRCGSAGAMRSMSAPCSARERDRVRRTCEVAKRNSLGALYTQHHGMPRRSPMPLDLPRWQRGSCMHAPARL